MEPTIQIRVPKRTHRILGLIRAKSGKTMGELIAIAVDNYYSKEIAAAKNFTSNGNVNNHLEV